MQISYHIHAGVLVLIVEGRMNFPVRKIFQGVIEKTKLSRPHQIILNFYHVPSMDSAGIGILMLAHKIFGEANIPLSIEVSEGNVPLALALANIEKAIPISTTTAKPSPSSLPALDTILRNA